MKSFVKSSVNLDYKFCNREKCCGCQSKFKRADKQQWLEIWCEGLWVQKCEIKHSEWWPFRMISSRLCTSVKTHRLFENFSVNCLLFMRRKTSTVFPAYLVWAAFLLFGQRIQSLIKYFLHLFWRADKLHTEVLAKVKPNTSHSRAQWIHRRLKAIKWKFKITSSYYKAGKRQTTETITDIIADKRLKLHHFCASDSCLTKSKQIKCSEFFVLVITFKTDSDCYEWTLSKSDVLTSSMFSVYVQS